MQAMFLSSPFLYSQRLAGQNNRWLALKTSTTLRMTFPISSINNTHPEMLFNRIEKVSKCDKYTLGTRNQFAWTFTLNRFDCGSSHHNFHCGIISSHVNGAAPLNAKIASNACGVVTLHMYICIIRVVYMCEQSTFLWFIRQ